MFYKNELISNAVSSKKQVNLSLKRDIVDLSQGKKMQLL